MVDARFYKAHFKINVELPLSRVGKIKTEYDNDVARCISDIVSIFAKKIMPSSSGIEVVQLHTAVILAPFNYLLDAELWNDIIATIKERVQQTSCDFTYQNMIGEVFDVLFDVVIDKMLLKELDPKSWQTFTDSCTTQGSNFNLFVSIVQWAVRQFPQQEGENEHQYDLNSSWDAVLHNISDSPRLFCFDEKIVRCVLAMSLIQHCEKADLDEFYVCSIFLYCITTVVKHSNHHLHGGYTNALSSLHQTLDGFDQEKCSLLASLLFNIVDEITYKNCNELVTYLRTCVDLGDSVVSLHETVMKGEGDQLTHPLKGSERLVPTSLMQAVADMSIDTMSNVGNSIAGHFFAVLERQEISQHASDFHLLHWTAVFRLNCMFAAEAKPVHDFENSNTEFIKKLLEEYLDSVETLHVAISDFVLLTSPNALMNKTSNAVKFLIQGHFETLKLYFDEIKRHFAFLELCHNRLQKFGSKRFRRDGYIVEETMTGIIVLENALNNKILIESNVTSNANVHRHAITNQLLVYWKDGYGYTDEIERNICTMYEVPISNRELCFLYDKSEPSFMIIKFDIFLSEERSSLSYVQILDDIKSMALLQSSVQRCSFNWLFDKVETHTCILTTETVVSMPCLVNE